MSAAYNDSPVFLCLHTSNSILSQCKIFIANNWHDAVASILLKQPEGKVNDTFSLIKGLSFERNCGAETVESITRQFGLINSELIMFIGHHKEFLQLIFRALALRKTSVSETLHDGRLTSSNRLLKPNYLLFLWVTD